MAERNPGLSRRDFNKAVFFGLAALASVPLEVKIFSKFTSAEEDEFAYLNNIENVVYLPPELSGVHFNAPYLWKRSPEEIRRFVGLARYISGENYESLPVTHTVRIFPESSDKMVETELGIYDSGHLENLENFIENLPSDFKVIIPIIDGFFIFRSNLVNPFYGSESLNSVYLKDISDRKNILNSQIGFFLDTELQDAFKKRIDEFIKRFGNNEKVILEIGNELAVPLEGDEGRSVNTYWYRMMFDYMHAGYDKNILTGIQSPDLIDYKLFSDTSQLITTDHKYLPETETYPEDIPVVMEEIGAPNEIFKKPLHQADGYLKFLIESSVKKGIKSGKAYTGSIFLWQGDWEHNDNMDFRPQFYPETTNYVKKLSPKLREVFTAAEL